MMTVLATHPCGAFGAASPPRANAPTVPLVLLHAFPMDHRLWEPVAALLPDVPLILVDLPGFGQSRPISQPTLDAAGTALWRTLDQLGFDQIALAGLSMGGYLSMAALRAAPSRVAALALLDTKQTCDDPDTRRRRQDMAAEVTATNSIAPVRPMAEALLGPATKAKRPELVSEVASWIEDCQPAAIAWAQMAMADRHDSTQTLCQFTGPAAVIVGQDDVQAPPTVARMMADNLTNASFSIVPEAGHLTAVESPQVVAQLLRQLYFCS